MKHKMNKRVAAVTAALAVALGTAAVSAAYWTDKEVISSTVRAMDIGIAYDTETTGFDEDDLFVPGDSRPFSFTVMNTGSVSVDSKPVITITSNKVMTEGGSAFRIVDAQGGNITGYTAVYLDEEGNEVEAGEPYYTAEYTLADSMTLAGSEHDDPQRGEVSDSADFAYRLKLNEESGNDFQEAEATVTVSTYAIQHRNRNNQTDEWIHIAAAN